MQWKDAVTRYSEETQWKQGQDTVESSVQAICFAWANSDLYHLVISNLINSIIRTIRCFDG